MFCIVALIVFSILGIFSATHRELAREALSCVKNRVTFKPCESNFKDKNRDRITGWLLTKSVFLAKVFKKYYEVFAWIFFLLMLWSTVWVFRGVFNYYVYGSCNGLNESGFCAFDPKGGNNEVSEGESCGTIMPNPENVTEENVDWSLFPSINNNSKDNLIFVGCYGCEYTRETYPKIKKLLEKEKPNFTFAHLAVKEEADFLLPYEYCVYKNEGKKYFELMDYLFMNEKEYVLNRDNTENILNHLSFDISKINQCVADENTKLEVEKRQKELEKTYIYGTPTIFINGKSYIGPKPYRVYRVGLNKFILFDW